MQNVNLGAQLKLYPNPNTGNFTLSSIGGTLYITDMAGRTIAAYEVGAGSQDVQLPAALAPGLYIGTFKGNTGGQKTLRINYEPQ